MSRPINWQRIRRVAVARCIWPIGRKRRGRDRCDSFFLLPLWEKVAWTKSTPDEGSASAERDPSPVTMLTAFASCHPLPQGGEGKESAPLWKTRANAASSLDFPIQFSNSLNSSCMDGPLSARAFLVFRQVDRGAVMYTASRSGH